MTTTISPAAAVQDVLLVEDDDGDALLVEILLEEAFPEGFSVIRARSVDEARRLLADGPGPRGRCALIDLGLPDAQGLDALQAIRAAAPFEPVVVLTGLDDLAQGVRAVASGAQDYLVKGQVAAEGLRRAILYSVERCRADEANRLLLEEQLLGEENARLERGLLPTPLLERHADLRWDARYRPGSNRLRIGGDFYDIVEVGGTVHCVVGDVCGHGPDEAAVGVMLRMAWRALTRAGLEPAAVLAQLNDLMAVEALHPGQFTTLASLRLLDEARMGVTLAGHPPPVVLAGGAVHPVSARPGPPLGLWGDADWAEVVVDLPARATVLGYTDGLIEGRASPGSEERLGIDAVTAIIERLLAQGATGSALLDALMGEVEQHHGGAVDDDIALLSVAPPPGRVA